MTKIVPFESSYERVNQLEKYSFRCAVVAAILIVCIWLIDVFELNKIESLNLDFPLIIESFKVGSYVFITIFLILEVLTKILFSEAERIKREDLIDNSFGTKYSDEPSAKYYNNDNIEDGILKFALNTYESAFHTKQVLKRMLINSSLNLLFFSIPFIISIYINGGSNFIRMLFDISIPLVLLFKVVILIVYFTRVRTINTRFKTELLSIKNDVSLEIKQGKLLNPIMDYYNTKSWANVNLDSKVFNKMNAEISSNWEKRKKSLGY